MVDISTIMDMLDWNTPHEVQSKGISLAKNLETITPFIQPLTPRHNKNVWGNCAIIIAEQTDEKLEPHLVKLLEWLQDMNWPGAFCILDRLRQFNDYKSLSMHLEFCLNEAQLLNDDVWEENLNLLMAHSTGDG